VNKRLSSEILQMAAQRASRRSFFVASALAMYQRLHRLEEDELAVFLGCTPAALPRLALCRLPETGAPDFRVEVERIASYSGVDRVRLVEILREVESTAALRGAQQPPGVTTGQGVLMAARDRLGAASPGEEGHPSASSHPGAEPLKP